MSPDIEMLEYVSRRKETKRMSRKNDEMYFNLGNLSEFRSISTSHQ